MKAIEAVLLASDSTSELVESFTLAYQHDYQIGVLLRLPDRIRFDERVFAIDETIEDENGRVAYYVELTERERIEGT